MLVISDFAGNVTEPVNKCSSPPIKGDWVIVYMVLLRLKSVQVRIRVNIINTGRQVICDEEGVTVVDIRDKTTNDGYYQKCWIHLTTKATNKLD